MLHYGHGFEIVWGVTAVPSIAVLIYRWDLRRKRGRLFPSVGKEQILYQEYFASGRSMKNALTMSGGARNCLKLTVTTDELWITSFPGLFADIYDLEHRIPKKDIEALLQEQGFRGGTSLLIEYRSADGRINSVEITPRRCEEFRRALRVGTLAAAWDSL
jgi:hypothetical protein